MLSSQNSNKNLSSHQVRKTWPSVSAVSILIMPLSTLQASRSFPRASDCGFSAWTVPETCMSAFPSINFQPLCDVAFLKKSMDINPSGKLMRSSMQTREKWHCLIITSEVLLRYLRNFLAYGHPCFLLLMKFFLFHMSVPWRILTNADKTPKHWSVYIYRRILF